MSICGAAVSLGMTAQSTYIADAYGINVVVVNSCVIVFTLTYIPMSFVAAWMYTNMRLSTVMRLGTSVICLGGWTRNICTWTGTFWPVLVGTTILSLPGPIILSCVSPVCNKWFGDKERSTATAILGLPSPIGGIVGLVIGGYFFHGVKKQNAE